VTAYIETHRGRFGVEPICRVLGVSASAYYQRKSGARSRRVVADERMLEVIRELHLANYEAYGSRRMWKALRRAGHEIGRDRVARLMRRAGIQGAKRRVRRWRTTTPDVSQRRPDLVERRFHASGPDELWVADFTYLRSWQGPVFLSFVPDVWSRRIVGWQFASHMRTDLVLDALRMALATRRSGADVELVHHSDRGSQLGFKGSSQRRLVGGTVGGRRGPRLAFSIRASCGVGRSGRRRQRRGLRGSVC
jgi:putative transposase